MIVVKEGGVEFYVHIEKGQCSCGHIRCKHVQYAKLVESNSRGNLFIFLSAAHKSIRMGKTSEALHFAGLVAARYGPAVVQRYIEKIFFEESRATSMFLELGSSWWTDVAIICAAPKKWERVQLYPQTARKAHAFLEALVNPEPPKDAKDLLNHQNYYSALSDIFRIRIAKFSKNRKAQLAKGLYDLLPPSMPTREALQKTNFKVHGYLFWTALEEFYELCPKSSISIGYSAEEPHQPKSLLYPPPSTYDNHTYTGLALMKRNWSSIAPGLPQPLGLDLRFTGAVFGCCFRENAFRQFGQDFVDVPWEEVTIDPYQWMLSLKLNSHYYPDFHQKVTPEIMAWDGRSPDL